MEDTNKIEILKLSASAVKTYETCPLKYYWTYIDKKPQKEYEHLKLGNFCHKVLENFHNDLIEDKNLDKKLLMKKYFEDAKKQYNLKYASLLQAKEMLSNYLIQYKQAPCNVLNVERSFNFDLNGNILVRGFIDRLDDENGIYHILDYKTSKDPKYMNPFQLKVYGVWLRKEYGIENYKGSYVMLRHNSSLISYDFTAKDIDDCEKELISFADKINESKLLANWVSLANETVLCQWCDFKNICPTQTSW